MQDESRKYASTFLIAKKDVKVFKYFLNKKGHTKCDLIKLWESLENKGD